MPIRCRARWAAVSLALALLLPAAANAQNAYIPNSGSNTVSVIDTVTNTVVATIPVGPAPLGVAVTPAGTKVYVTNSGDGTVSVIATATNTVVATIPVFAANPSGVAVTPDGAKVYVANTSSNTVSVVNTATNTVAATIPVGNAPQGVAVTPDGAKTYVANGNGRTVSVIATVSNTVVATIPVVGSAPFPFGVAVTPDGAKAYVANGQANGVSVIDTATDTVTTTIPGGSCPLWVAVTPDGAKVYVTGCSGTVSVIATATNTVTATIPVGINPQYGAAVTPDGAKVYVANFNDNTVSVIATATNTVVATIPGFNGPIALGKFIGGPLHGSPPVAANQSKTTTANTPVTIDLTVGASGNPTSAALVGTPVGGTVTGFPGTTVTFTPTAGFSGRASFQFTLANAFGRSNTATATITVSRPGPPVLSVTPATLSVGAAAGTASFNVSNTGGGTMSYTARITSDSPWLTITSGGSGGNSGTINVHYDVNNTGAQRPGTIQVYASGATGSPATVTITQAAGSAPTVAVHLVDPFLLGANLSSINLSPLYSAQNWAAVQAKGLVADDVSAAIAIVQTNDCTNNVTLTTTNRATLLRWNAGFLATPPSPGTQSLPITAADFGSPIGGFCFAAAWVQGPIGGPTPSFTHHIVVTAQQQGALPATAQAELVPPPVILVHGIWGSRGSLGGTDGAGASASLARYLKTAAPWSSRPDLVATLCYSKYFRFDAPIDPLIIAPIDPLAAGKSCEQTSRDAITSRIYGLLAYLDSQKIVGSRVDLVAHSMGGLAARYYASRSWYRSLRNRNQGQFHKIITLNTPEQGTKLAPFLNSHSDCRIEVPVFFWGFLCGAPLNPTVRKCFAAIGKPLAYGSDLTLGAVYSLFPDGPALQSLNQSNPNIPGAEWDAFSGIAQSSGLELSLNALLWVIRAGPSTNATCGPIPSRNIDGILSDRDNDAIVTRDSHLSGSDPSRQHTFPGLTHTTAVPGDTGVADSTDVHRRVRLLLCRSSDPGCLFGPAASVAEPGASETAPGNKDAVPMPHVVTKNPRHVDRLALRAPAGLELGKPFDLTVNTGTGGLPELHVVQTSEAGTQEELPVSISRVEGQTVHLAVTPKFHGATRLQVTAAYPDGGVATKEVAANVNLPTLPPNGFHADELYVTGIPLVAPGSPPIDSHNPTLRLQPWGLVFGARVYLPTNMNIVRFSIDPPSGSSVIKLDANGIIHPLRVGTATVKAKYINPTPPHVTLTSQVQVNVVNPQQ